MIEQVSGSQTSAKANEAMEKFNAEVQINIEQANQNKQLQFTSEQQIAVDSEAIATPPSLTPSVSPANNRNAPEVVVLQTTQTEAERSIQAFKTEVDNANDNDMLDIKKTSELTALQKMNTAAGKSGMLLPKSGEKSDRTILSHQIGTQKIREEQKEKESELPEGMDKIDVATD